MHRHIQAPHLLNPPPKHTHTHPQQVSLRGCLLLVLCIFIIELYIPPRDKPRIRALISTFTVSNDRSGAVASPYPSAPTTTTSTRPQRRPATLPHLLHNLCCDWQASINLAQSVFYHYISPQYNQTLRGETPGIVSLHKREIPSERPGRLAASTMNLLWRLRSSTQPGERAQRV